VNGQTSTGTWLDLTRATRGLNNRGHTHATLSKDDPPEFQALDFGIFGLLFHRELREGRHERVSSEKTELFHHYGLGPQYESGLPTAHTVTISKRRLDWDLTGLDWSELDCFSKRGSGSQIKQGK
jgi:hypothetical protein